MKLITTWTLLLLFGYVYCTITNFTDIEICAAYRYTTQKGGIPGTKGVPSAQYLPSAREKSSFTRDEKRNMLWLYGGSGNYADGSSPGIVTDIIIYFL